MADIMTITLCYAPSDADVRQKTVQVPAGATVEAALVAAGWQQAFDWTQYGIGVYGKRKAPDSRLHDGDRLEIYPPLTADPKMARQRRVDKQRRAQPDRWVRR